MQPQTRRALSYFLKKRQMRSQVRNGCETDCIAADWTYQMSNRLAQRDPGNLILNR